MLGGNGLHELATAAVLICLALDCHGLHLAQAVKPCHHPQHDCVVGAEPASSDAYLISLPPRRLTGPLPPLRMNRHSISASPRS